MFLSFPRSASPSNFSVCHISLAVGMIVSALALAGCGASSPSGIATQPAALSGSLHGGQQPVSGALVQLIAPSTLGYGLPGTVITSTASLADGSFTLPRPYICPANSGLVYLLATDGNAGGGLNPGIGLAAIVGDCNSLKATDFFQVNEVTTVAAAYALAPFATVAAGVASIGTSATNLQGLINAGGSAASLVDVHTGLARDPQALTDVVLPTSEVNLIANILAGCVNQGTQDNTASACTTLFTATTPSPASVPTDTFQAAINIALHPGANVTTLAGLQSAFAPFQPSLTPTPPDFALGIQFTQSLITQSYNGPTSVDIDAQGNAWISIFTNPGTALQEISPSSQYLGGTAGIPAGCPSHPSSISITPSGNIMVGCVDDNKVYNVTPGGTATALTSTSISVPFGVAFDNHDQSVWATSDVNNRLIHFTPSGGTYVPASGSPYTTGIEPHGVAVSGNGDIWTANSDGSETGFPNSSLTRLRNNNDGTYTAANVALQAGTQPFDLAIDNGGNVWSTLATSVGKNGSDGTPLSPAGGFVTNSTDLHHTSAQGIEIDGLNRAIVFNGAFGSFSGFGSVAIFANDGTFLSTSDPGYGYTANGIIPNFTNNPKSLAIDGSGNVWIAGISANNHGPYSVVEIVGVAAPAVTPLSAATSPNRLGQRP